MPAASPTSAVEGAQLDRPLYCLLSTRGAVCAGQVRQGQCVLLFSSTAVAAAFAGSVGVEVQPPIVFSRSRSEFLTQAGRSFRKGYIGGLVDPSVGACKTAFLGFNVDQR